MIPNKPPSYYVRPFRTMVEEWIGITLLFILLLVVVIGLLMVSDAIKNSLLMGSKGEPVSYLQGHECKSGKWEVTIIIEDNPSESLGDGRLVYAWMQRVSPYAVELHLPKLHTLNDLRSWGHELSHVACGSWHE